MKLYHYLRQQWQQRALTNESYRFLFAPPTQAGVVSIDCETTGLDPNKDDIISLAAIRIVENRILTGEHLALKIKPTRRMSGENIKIHKLRNCDVEDGLAPLEAMAQLLHFIGSSPIVGYYLSFDVALINRLIKPWLGIELPNKQIELSAYYYDQKVRSMPYQPLDLRLKTICQVLDVPDLGEHDAYIDALTVAIAYVKLTQQQETRSSSKRLIPIPSLG